MYDYNYYGWQSTKDAFKQLTQLIITSAAVLSMSQGSVDCLDDPDGRHTHPSFSPPSLLTQIYETKSSLADRSPQLPGLLRSVCQDFSRGELLCQLPLSRSSAFAGRLSFRRHLKAQSCESAAAAAAAAGLEDVKSAVCVTVCMTECVTVCVTGQKARTESRASLLEEGNSHVD